MNPHEKVPSVEQDNWHDLMTAIHGSLLKIAMNSKPSPEEVCCLIRAVDEAVELHLKILCFDGRVSAWKEKLERFAPESECSH